MAQTTLTYADASGATQTLEATTGSAHTITNTRICDAATHFLPPGDAVARTIFVTGNDGTNQATFKAASTPPLTTDTAQVVCLSPNQAIFKASTTAAATTDLALVVAVSPNNSPWVALTSGVATSPGRASLNAGVYLAWASNVAPTTGQACELQTDVKGRLLVAVQPTGVPFYAGSGDSGGAAQITAAITGTANLMNYLDKVMIDGTGATAGSTIAVTIAGLLGGTLTFSVGVPAGATVPMSWDRSFNPPLQASAVNTAITVTVPSFGTGNLSSSVCAFGHKI